jgi:hypothetical protein
MLERHEFPVLFGAGPRRRRSARQTLSRIVEELAVLDHRGESSGAGDGPLLAYLSALEAFDKRFPGFEHDIHGVQRDAHGNYAIECLVLDMVPVRSNGSDTAAHEQPVAVGAGPHR